MSLRPLIDIAAENERLHALASRVRAAADGGEEATVRASTMLRPLLLAALLEDDRGLSERPALLVAPDDRSARDLAADLRAYLAPRRVRLYPSRGTGYASHVTPPPHLVGLRIDALDALGSEADAVVVASATALAEAVPDTSLRPAGFAIALGEEIELDAVASDLVGAGYERVEQVEERGQFAVRGGILDVFPATEERAVRIELFGDEVESMRWFSTFTQRSLGEAERVELAPAAELDAEHRELAELAAMAAEEEGKESPNLAEALPLEHFRAPLEFVPDAAAVVLVGEEEIEPALRDHWEDVTTAMHAEDAQHLYVDVAAPLAERAALSLTGVGDDDEDAFRASPRRVPRPQRQGGGGRAGETGPLRLPHRRRFREPGRGRARPLRPRPPRRPPARRRSRPARPGPLLRRGAPARGLRQPGAEARGLPLPPPRPPPPQRGAGARRRPRPARLQRTAGRRLRRPRGPRRRPLRRLRDPRGRRRHPRLPLPRIQRRRPRLRPHRPAGEAEPLRRRWRRTDALRAGRQTLAEHEGAGAQGRWRHRRRAAQPLRRAPRPQRSRLPARLRMADRDGDRLPLPRDRRPDGSDRGGQGGHGVRAADGPAGLRRRRLRQDRGGAARRRQGRLRRQAGDGPGADDYPGPAALRHLPRAPRRPAVPGRGRLPPASAGGGESDPQGLRGGQGRRPDRHPPAALPRRPRQGAGSRRR